MDDDRSSDRSSSPSMSQENVPPHVTITQSFQAPVPGSYPNTWPYTIGFTGDHNTVNVTIHPPTVETGLAPQQQKPRTGNKRAASNENIASMTTAPNKRHPSVGRTPSPEDRVLQTKPVSVANNIQNVPLSMPAMSSQKQAMPVQRPSTREELEAKLASLNSNAALLASMAMMNTRHGSATPSPEERAFQAKILSKTSNIEDFDVFQSDQDHAKDLAMASKDVKVSKADIDLLLESIPLEDRAGGETDLTETALATMYLKTKPDKLGNPVVPGMKVSLMQHQLIGVKWMCERENDPAMGLKNKIDEQSMKRSYGKVQTVATVGGGLLADEMGLGKTIQSIALMIHNKPQRDDPVKTTLIVAPLALLHQWKREIEKRTKRGMFRVHIHHGGGQLRTRKEFLECDVVITTYGTLMQGYPSNKIPNKKHMKEGEKEEWEEWLEEQKGIMFKIEWFRIILDEAHFIKNPHVRSSLACGQLLSARKWCLTGTPLHNCLKDMYSLFRFLEVPVYQHYVNFRETFESRSGNGLKDGAITLQVLLRSLMMRRKKDDKVNGRPLIVLPPRTISEQYIELNPDERGMYTAIEQRARMRINKYLREGEATKNYSNILAMLVRLRQLCIHPFLIVEHVRDTWTVEDVSGFAKNSIDNPSVLTKMIEQIIEKPAGDWTECTICLDVPTMPVMTTCRHVFCSECINGVFDMPTARGEAANEEDEEVEALGESIACPVCRHKLHKTDIGKFTPPKDKNAPLDPEEAKESFKKIDWESHSDGDSDNESLPDLTTAFLKKKPVANKEVAKKAIVPAKPELPPLPSLEDIAAAHADEDLFALFKSLPVPKVAVKKDRSNVPEKWANLLDGDYWQSSSKLDAMRDQLREWWEDHSEDKVIIFSQFVRALDLVEKICDMEGWNCLRYQGDMTLDQREATLRTFEDDPDVPFMLTSLKCGGVGLNLTVANKVICMDLWWNWQVENQAIDRAHRTGQKKPVDVRRIIVKNSVEERILALQEQKKTLAATALGDEASGRIGRLTINELLGLFGKLTRDREGNMRVE